MRPGIEVFGIEMFGIEVFGIEVLEIELMTVEAPEAPVVEMIAALEASAAGWLAFRLLELLELGLSNQHYSVLHKCVSSILAPIDVEQGYRTDTCRSSRSDFDYMALQNRYYRRSSSDNKCSLLVENRE